MDGDVYWIACYSVWSAFNTCGRRRGAGTGDGIHIFRKIDSNWSSERDLLVWILHSAVVAEQVRMTAYIF